MNKTLFLLSILLVSVLSSCFEVPEFKGISNFKLDEINADKVHFNLDAKVFNPNGYGIRIRKSSFDLFLGDTYVGKAKIKKAFKMKRKRESDCHIPVEVKLEKGMLMKLMAIVSKRSLDVRLKGVLKASVMGVPRREKIDERKTISPKDFNLKLGNVFGK